jgi:hypothetical protein
MYYNTRDSDLLISLSILPNSVNSFSGKTSLSAKIIAKLIVESKLLGGCLFRFGSFNRCLLIFSMSISMIRVDVCLPCFMITRFVIRVHPIMFHNAAVMISSALMIRFPIVSDRILLFDHAPWCDSVWSILFVAAWSLNLINNRSDFRLCLSGKGSNLFFKF